MTTTNASAVTTSPTRRRYLLLAATLGLLASCQSPPSATRTASAWPNVPPSAPEAIPAPTSPPAQQTQESQHGALERSEAVIATKIARKEAKIAGRSGADREDPEESDPDEDDAAQNPHERAQEWYSIMAGPDGVFSFQEVLEAKAHADRMPILPLGIQPRDAGIWNWQWLGPGNIGGRIRSIVIHPTNTDLMWIGGVSGGIWRSEDGGGFWYPINDFLPTLAIGCMTMHPSNPNIMFVGTGEMDGSGDFMPGAGIFKSTDGGWNWRQIPDTANWRYVTRISVSPTSSQNVLAATNSGLYRSVDTGETWSLVTDVPQIRLMDVKFHPSNGSLAVAGTMDFGDVYYTTNGGIDWHLSNFDVPPAETTLTQATTPDGDDEPDLIHVVSTVGFEIWDQTDLGTGGSLEDVSIDEEVESGTQMYVKDLQFAHAVGEPIASRRKNRVELAWAAGEPSIVYASMNVGRGTIWGSGDGGATFVRLNNESAYLGKQGNYDNTIWASPVNYLDVVVGGIDLWRSDNGGQTLTRISRWQEYHTGDSAHADHHYILEHPNFDGVTNSTVFFANDGGIQKANNVLTVSTTSGWTNLANNLGITQFYRGAASPDGQFVLGGTQDNDTLRYYEAYGEDWYQAETGDGGYCAMNYADPEAPVFFGEYTHLAIERSTNHGGSWYGSVLGLSDAGDSAKTLFVAPFTADPSNGNNLVAGGTSIWRTTNSGGFCTWGSIRDPIPRSPGWTRDPKCSAIDIAASDGNIIWVGYEDGQLALTTNAGSSWTNVDNNDWLNPLPNRFITDIAISPHDPFEVLVTLSSTAPDNVWYTGTAGAFWYDATGSGDTGLPDITVHTATWHPTNASWIYVGTAVGLFASEDGGATWNRTPAYGDHDGPCNTSIHDLFWAGDQLIAATHGRGMYRCRPLDNVYVDWDAGWPEDGSQLYPYDTVTEGVAALGNGTDLHISAGDYDEGTVIRIETRSRVTATGGSVIIR